MIGWIVRGLAFVAAGITALFVAEDAPNFGIIQVVIAVVLVTLFVAIAAFWEAIADWLRDKRNSN